MGATPGELEPEDTWEDIGALHPSRFGGGFGLPCQGPVQVYWGLQTRNGAPWSHPGTPPPPHLTVREQNRVSDSAHG